MRRAAFAFVMFLAGCGSADADVPNTAAVADDTGSSDSESETGSDAVVPPEDTMVESDAAPVKPPAVEGEKPGVDGDNAVSVPAGGETIFRVESKPTEHIHFMLTFSPSSQPVVLHVDRWNGAERVELGATDAGGGLRTLAVFDGKAEATFWVRVTSKNAFNGKLTITRTPFADGLNCPSDCAHLLQLPLPNDPAVDGYDTDSGTVFRYQFGRRDMLMLLRHAGRAMIALKKPPFYPYDLSQWNGETPGTDVGAPRHASHQRGKDVDVSLYGEDGKSIWRSFCTTTSTSDGRQCVNGSAKGFDARMTAREIGAFYEGGIVTMMFLDNELIELVRPAAPKIAADGLIDSKLVPLYSDGTHLQNWPNHDNHVHVRISEGAKFVIGTEPVEAP